MLRQTVELQQLASRALHNNDDNCTSPDTYLSFTELRLQVLLGLRVLFTQLMPSEPQSLLDRSTSCALATRLAQLSGMLPVMLLLASNR